MRKTIRTTALALAAAAVLAPGAFAASGPEQFNGVVYDQPNVTRGTTTFFLLQVDRWGTEEEAASYLKILKEKGQKALIEAFWDAEDSGFVRVGNKLGYPIIFAREIPREDGSRVVRAFTDRPIQFFEAMNNTRSRDYPLAIIEIVFPKEGKGEGMVIPAAQAGFDEKGQLGIENRGTQPFKLLNMTAKAVKEKKKD